MKLEIDKTEFEFLYYHVRHQYDIIKRDKLLGDDNWEPSFKRIITKLKNKMDKVISDV